MKIGAENKKQLIAMVVLLVIAVAVGIYDFSGAGGTAAAPPASTSASATSAATRKSGVPQMAPNMLDPTLRIDVLDASRKVKYEAGGRNIFRMEEPPIPKVVTPVVVAPIGPPTPTPTPPPPPIPLKFYGFESKPNEPKRIFLAEGTSVFVAREGDIIDRRYKVLQIQATSVVIEDVLNNNKQTIPLTAK